jgi:hypothetical protein
MDPAFLAALAGVSGVTFCGLQKGDGVVPPRALIEAGCFVDLAPELDVDTGAFMDTAAGMAQLDLVITVDTAVPHLAGALARPGWVMLAAVPEWRWLLAREDSPWYPTMRLFRQSAACDWGDVVARVEAELRRLVSEWLGHG